ncbi:sensor histidine kinase [Aestuariibius sp. 2305UL40-4]|uniref:sensor histidine kinase n=1 Tax=Aestuariibius violaceus TaxID=3234132 RepID=UPI00345E6EB3
MRSTRLFTIYAMIIVGLILGLSVLALYSIDKARWWDARTQLAQQSYSLHLKLQSKTFQLFKQHGDALLIGDRDGGAGEADLRGRIADNLADIRTVIAQEIQMVGDEEIEELERLDAIEGDIRAITTALTTLYASGEPIENAVQVERLADLLDQEIDMDLSRKIDAALAEELEEMEEVIAEAVAFRTANQRLVYGFLVLSLTVLLAALVSFNTQIRAPLIRLREAVARLRQAQYDTPIDLHGSREFRDLATVLRDMAEGLAKREASREEQKKELERRITERTAELQRLVRQIETNEANRKRLMADISHELRTPLAIILGEADVTLRTNGDMPDDISDALARIRDSAKHTNQIVDDMLTVARHEAGQLRLDRRDTDLRKVLRDAADMFPGAVSVDMPSQPVRAMVDEVRLRQSVLAVFQNARRYGGPTITARLETDGSRLRFTIEDDGPGMTDDEKAQAFQRFFRGSNANGQALEGSGLGLPIVKAILEAHGGTARLEDGATRGLRVVLDLPRSPQIRAVDPIPSIPASRSA